MPLNGEVAANLLVNAKRWGELHTADGGQRVISDKWVDLCVPEAFHLQLSAHINAWNKGSHPVC